MDLPPRQSLFRRLPSWLKWRCALWLAAIVAWIPAVYGVLSHHGSTLAVALISGVFGGTALLGTVLFGVSMGYRRQWGYLGWSFLLGVAAIGLVIFMSFESAVPANSPDDPGVGLGAMLATVMVAIVVAGFLWFGEGVGSLVRRLKAPNE